MPTDVSLKALQIVRPGGKMRTRLRGRAMLTALPLARLGQLQGAGKRVRALDRAGDGWRLTPEEFAVAETSAEGSIARRQSRTAPLQ